MEVIRIQRAIASISLHAETSPSNDTPIHYQGLVIRVIGPEIFTGFSGVQQILLVKLRFALVYVYIFSVLLIKMQNGMQRGNVVSIRARLRFKFILESKLKGGNKSNFGPVLNYA
jgi:hypothetical protein